MDSSEGEPCVSGQAAVGHFREVHGQVTGGRWRELGRGNVGQMDLSCTDHISLLPDGDPGRGSEQAPRKNGVLLRPWHCALLSLGLHPFP